MQENEEDSIDLKHGTKDVAITSDTLGDPPIQFVNFGCWNKQLDIVKKVKDSINETGGFDFLIVNGDNYYQSKEKIKTKDENGDPINIKIKKVINQDLIDGFDILKGINIREKYLLMGNHDLDLTTKSDSNPEGKHCETIEEELKFSENMILPRKLVMFVEPRDDTIIIMIDTNMYTGENLFCYTHILDEETTNKLIEELRILGSDINISHDNPNLTNAFKNLQKKIIEEYFESRHKTWKNVFISGHHPLIGFKKIKGGTLKYDYYEPELYELLYDTIRRHGINFYYLCADIHNYQEAEVKINNMVILEYIVGTGGAELDEIKPANYNLDISIGGIDLSYKANRCDYSYGYNIVKINESGDVSFEYIRVSVPIEDVPIEGVPKEKKEKKEKKDKKVSQLVENEPQVEPEPRVEKEYQGETKGGTRRKKNKKNKTKKRKRTRRNKH
jgi:hypothetical protein